MISVLRKIFSNGWQHTTHLFSLWSASKTTYVWSDVRSVQFRDSMMCGSLAPKQNHWCNFPSYPPKSVGRSYRNPNLNQQEVFKVGAWIGLGAATLSFVSRSTEGAESGSCFWHEFGTQNQRNHRKGCLNGPCKDGCGVYKPECTSATWQTDTRATTLNLLPTTRAEQVRSRHEDRFSWRWSNRDRVCASRVQHENASLCGERGRWGTAPLTTTTTFSHWPTLWFAHTIGSSRQVNTCLPELTLNWYKNAQPVHR